MLSAIKKIKPDLLKLYKADGLERLGFILENALIESNNVSDKKDQGARMPAWMIVQYAEKAVAVWHTHPGAPGNLSVEDYPTVKSWPNLYHVIIGSDGLRCFKFDKDKDTVLEVDLGK